MRHVSRTRRANLDRLLERIKLHSNISVKYVHINQQIADILTTSSFTRDKLDELMTLFGIVLE